MLTKPCFLILMSGERALMGLIFVGSQSLKRPEWRFPFFEEEVAATLKDLNGDKALGLDGYTSAFW